VPAETVTVAVRGLVPVLAVARTVKYVLYLVIVNQVALSVTLHDDWLVVTVKFDDVAAAELANVYMVGVTDNVPAGGVAVMVYGSAVVDVVEL
jgi:hypothetical protein